MPPLAPLTAAATRVADVSGQGTATAVFGLSNEIVEIVKDVRVNAAAAEALSRQLRETMNVLSSVLEEEQQEPSLSDFVQNIERFLSKTRATLQTITKRSYLSQLLYRERDRGRLQDVSLEIRTAFDSLMVDLRLRASVDATELSKKLEDMLAAQPLQPSDVSDNTPGVAPVHSALRIPPPPHLHFGRTDEVEATVAVISSQPAGHVAILGGPGMGKTTLALAALHHSSVIERFGAKRFFVRCDAVDGQTNCLSVVSSAFGVVDTDVKATHKRLLSTLRGGPTLLVLDNFESAWESHDQRDNAEQLLHLLGTVENLSLIVTLRGSERPGGVKWRRPFLSPLVPLGDTAARHTFLAIADVVDTDPTLDVLLRQLDNIPLAIVLMANLAQSESLQSLRRRWIELETAMLTRGGILDRTNSLNISIELSLQSPRMQAAPGARHLLSVLALLPTGVTDVDIRLWHPDWYTQALPVLVKTSLATYQGDGRVYVLAPVRSFMLANHPPSEDETAPIYDYYFGLAELVPARTHSLDPEAFSLVAAEMGNIDAVVRYALKHSQKDVARAIQAVEALSIVHVASGIGSAPELLPLAASMAREAGLANLHADLLLRWARVSKFSSVPGHPMDLARGALEVYERSGNTRGVLSARIFLISSHPHQAAKSEARELLAIAEAQGDRYRMASCAQELAALLMDEGDYVDAIALEKLAISLAETATGPKAGHERLIGDCRFSIAECMVTLGAIKDAIEMYHSALRVYEAEGYANGVVRVHLQLAELFRAQGALRASIQHAERALAVKGAEGFRHYSENLMVLASANALAGDFEAAQLAIDRVYELYFSHDLPPSSHCRLLFTQAIGARLSGDLAEARALLSAARIIVRRKHPIDHPARMRNIEANLLEGLCDVEISGGRNTEALILAITSATLFRGPVAGIEPVHCLVLLADVVDDSTAGEIIDAVLPALQRMGSVHGIAISLVRSATIARRRGQRRLARYRAENALKHFGEIKDVRRLDIARSLLVDG
ncbi:hypothetical protein AURDEDRAFT_163347 [Auricularia subglabra TFB-10046 SS5]|nr:hypothetical protein AURDEDRAFT_163347 [Auricularia subglabra TFB-10046 SS5]